MPVQDIQLPASYRRQVLMTVQLVVLAALLAALAIASVVYSMNVRLVLLLATALIAVSWWVTHRGAAVVGTHLVIGTVQGLATLLALLGQGLNDVAFAIMPALLILGGLLLPRRQYWLMVTTTTLSVFIVAFATAAGYIEPTLVFRGLPRIWGEAAALLVILLAEAAMVQILVGGVLRFFAESERRQQELQRMHDALRSENYERQQAEAAVRALNIDLEQRVNQRTADLRTLINELDAFNYSVSHDLRAPLRAIVGFSQVAQEEVDRDPGQAKQLLARVQAAGIRMNTLIDDLLRLSKTSTQALQLHPVDLPQLLREIVHELPSHEQAWLQLDLPTPAVTLPGDTGLLRLALTNLIGNAVKYSRQQSAPHIHIAVQPGPESLVVQIRDNGIGFAADQSPRLFKAFSRLENARGFEGTGIGLAIVHRVIERHHGRIWAESEPGHGACFSLALPLQATAGDPPG